MAFEEINEKADEIKQNAKILVDTNIAYYKLWGFKVAMKSTTLFVKFVLIVLCLSFVLLLASVALSIALGEFFGSYALGFLAVSGIYLVVSIALFFIKSNIIEGTTLEKFSEIFFND
jgi:hypothetical protein